jgi:hypothetical protein
MAKFTSKTAGSFGSGMPTKPAPAQGQLSGPANIMGGAHKSNLSAAMHARVNKGAC